MGANLEAIDSSHQTPLLAAMRHGSLGVIRLLIARGANALAISPRGMNALHLAATNRRHDLIPDLCAAGVPVEGRMQTTETPLHVAAAVGPTESVTALLAAGADIDALHTSCGWTPLHTAANLGGTEMVDFLIEHGADVSAVDNRGYTALDTAVRAGRISAFNVLLTATQEADLPILHESLNGTSALEEAIFHEQDDIATVLIEAGVDVAASRNGTYPLHLALLHGAEGIVESLLENGADPFAIDERGRSAVDWARLNGQVLPTILAHCDEEAVEKRTDPALQNSILRKSIVSLAKYLLTSKNIIDDANHFTRLGGCLVQADNIPAATVAFGQLIETPGQEEREYHGYCDWCEDRPVLTERTEKYVCLTCYNVNLCQDCKYEYEDEEDYHSENPLFQVCTGHELLEVEPSVLQLLGDKTGVEGDIKGEWLEGIIAMYN
jgi:ankyrin repeat protein